MKLLSRLAFLLQCSRTEWEFGELLLEPRQCVELPTNPGTRYSNGFSRYCSKPLSTTSDLLSKFRVEDNEYAGTMRPASVGIAMLRDAVRKPCAIASIEPRIITTFASLEPTMSLLKGCSPLPALV